MHKTGFNLLYFYSIDKLILLREHNMTLKEILPGKRCTVLNIIAENPLKKKLLSMGITPGTNILVKKSAPHGGPMQIYLRGYDLIIRKLEAQTVIVK